MTSDDEILKKISEVSLIFTGQLDDLTRIVGMVVVGRLYGWRVIRLVHSRRVWILACSYFGDLKEILPERGFPEYVRKSVGLSIVDKLGDYWGIVRGSVKSDLLPIRKRKLIK